MLGGLRRSLASTPSHVDVAFRLPWLDSGRVYRIDSAAGRDAAGLAGRYPACVRQTSWVPAGCGQARFAVRACDGQRRTRAPIHAASAARSRTVPECQINSTRLELWG